MMKREDIQLRARELFRSKEVRIEKQVREMAQQAAQQDGRYPTLPFRAALQLQPYRNTTSVATGTAANFTEITVEIPPLLTDPFERQMLAEEIIWDTLDGMKERH